MFAKSNHAPGKRSVSAHLDRAIQGIAQFREGTDLLRDRGRDLVVAGTQRLFEEKTDVLKGFYFLFLIAGDEGREGGDLVDFGEGLEFSGEPRSLGQVRG